MRNWNLYLSETLIHFGPQTLKMNEYSHFNTIKLIFCTCQTCFMLSFWVVYTIWHVSIFNVCWGTHLIPQKQILM